MQQGKTCHWLILGLLFALGCAMPEEGAPSTLTNQVPGTGMLTGEVTAPGAFQAAKVYAKNVDKNIIYMVYTGGGRYQTVAMLPGSYEAWVEKTGFESDSGKDPDRGRRRAEGGLLASGGSTSSCGTGHLHGIGPGGTGRECPAALLR